MHTGSPCLWFLLLAGCQAANGGGPSDVGACGEACARDMAVDRPPVCEPTEEACNGADDDCDGVADEAVGGGRLTRPCHLAGAEGCAPGRQACEAGRWLSCENAELPTIEICDGRDQDCDGQVDEGEAPGQPLPVRCFSGPVGAAGVGLCREGVAPCVDGRPGVCVGEVLPGPEVCAGVDEDCDGVLDEAEGPAACSVGVGACTQTGHLVCVDGRPECDARPSAPTAEICNEIDDDCDGVVDLYPTCEAFASCRAARDLGHTESGPYRLRPGPDLSVVEVWCDQATDGGGWTRVAASAGRPPDDAALPAFADLARAVPLDANAGVWNALRGLDTRFDVRFACRTGADLPDGPFTVDVSVYGVPWYHEWTRGADADSCFQPEEHPARRNGRTGHYLAAGQAWAVGDLVGEDACDDRFDFAFDFADRGVRGDPRDGTDWGLSDGIARCGEPVADGQWFLFVREASAWRRERSFRVSDGPPLVPRDGVDPPIATSCRAVCAGDDAPEAVACSSRPDVLDRRAWLDGFGDDGYCRGPAAEAPEGFVLPIEGAPYDCGGPGCTSYSAWVDDHGCDRENHCWRAEAPPEFVPPAPGSQGTAGTGLDTPWTVCSADEHEAWLVGDAQDAADVCRAVGYAEADEDATCRNDCEFCQRVLRVEGAEHPEPWRCVR